jgi:uncharacterized membrane protein YhfC
MNGLSQLSGAQIAAYVIAIALEFLYPIGLAVVIGRRLGVSWRYFGYGALIFFLFQIITRLPLIQIIQASIAPQLRASPALLYGWIAVAAVTAGLFEEVGRYVGYRWLMRREEKTWNKAIMYGLGHGGLESIMIAGLVALTLVNLLLLPTVFGSLTAEQRALAVQQMAAITAQPTWAPLLGAWERLWSVPVQVALSVVVLQVFRRGGMRWLWLAIGAHALVDLLVSMVPRALGLTGTGALLLPEALVTVAGLLGLWVIWALRDRPEATGVPVAAGAPGRPPLATEAGLPERTDD